MKTITINYTETKTGFEISQKMDKDLNVSDIIHVLDSTSQALKIKIGSHLKEKHSGLGKRQLDKIADSLKVEDLV